MFLKLFTEIQKIKKESDDKEFYEQPIKILKTEEKKGKHFQRKDEDESSEDDEFITK